QEQHDFTNSGGAQTATTTITRDTSDQSLVTTGPNGGTVTNTYDANGNVLTSTDALGNETLRAYNAGNQNWCVVKPAEVKNGVTCPSTEPTSPPSPGSSDPYAGAAITFYNSVGEITATTDPLGNTATFSYTSGVSGVPDDLLYCMVDPASYQASVTCPAYGATHVTGTATSTYDSAGDKLTSTTASGATTSYSYSYGSTHPGLMSSSTDPNGTVTSYLYNGAGEPTQVQTTFNGFTSTTLKAYDQYGRQYCEVDPIEAAASVTCPSSPPSASSSPPAHVSSTFYDADGNVVQTTSALGGTSITAYDGVGLPYCTVNAKEYAASVTCPTSEPTTQPTPSSDPYLGATITSYNELGLPIQVTNALGGIKTEAYNAFGQVASSTSKSNNTTAAPNVTTTYTYDLDNAVTHTTVGTSALSTTVAYDPNGNVYCTDSAVTYPTYPQCPTWTNSWVAAPPNPSTLYWSGSPTAHPSSAAYANGVTTDFYNADGKLVQSSTPDVATTIDALNADGKPYCTSDPTNVAAYLAGHSGSTYPYNCPSTAPTSQPTSGSNPGYATVIYDAAGNVLSQSNANADITSHTYDASGDVLTTTDPNSKVTTFCYYYENATGQCAAGAPSGGGTASSLYSQLTPVTSADPSGELTSYTYGPDGQLATSVTPAGTDTLTYNDTGNKLTSTWSGVASGYSTPATVTNTYNSDGTLATRADATGSTTYAYDAVGDKTSEALTAGSGTGLANTTTGYSYFDTGLLAGVTYPSYGSYSNPALSYTYDATGNMASSTDWLGNVVTYTHDNNGPSGNQTGQDNNVSSGAPNGTSNTSVAYSEGSVPLGTTATTCVTGTSGTVGVSTPDSVNPGAQVTSASFSNSSCGASATTSSESYSYTTAGQAATENLGSGANSFSYDTAGNLTQMTQPATPGTPTTNDTFTQAFDNAGEVTSQTPVTGSGGSSTSFTYDTLGDQTAASGGISSTSSYDAAGKLASQSSGSATTTYLYAGDGLETGASTTTGSTTAVTQLDWERAGGLQGESNPVVISDGTYDYVFGPNGTPSEEIALGTSTPTYLAYDNANDTWTATSQSGTLTGFWGYDAYGTLAFGSPVSGYGYSSQWTDATSGLTNDRARSYDAATGTFTTRDPAFAQTDTAYGYANGDPVNGGDPTGLDANPFVHQVSPPAGCYGSTGIPIFLGAACPKNASQMEQAQAQIAHYYAAPSTVDQVGGSLGDFVNGMGSIGRTPEPYCSSVAGDESALGAVYGWIPAVADGVSGGRGSSSSGITDDVGDAGYLNDIGGLSIESRGYSWAATANANPDAIAIVEESYQASNTFLLSSVYTRGLPQGTGSQLAAAALGASPIAPGSTLVISNIVNDETAAAYAANPSVNPATTLLGKLATNALNYNGLAPGPMSWQIGPSGHLDITMTVTSSG
ncbi:MAG TPA: RHS repeat-associated core domain-containing protein, partial [Acidimicrobiales bacterium]|nr:RHS repeat-associated core domain-containing protein [Acidimicrobiales bacterium]